jgi:hypothetical protein
VHIRAVISSHFPVPVLLENTREHLVPWPWISVIGPLENISSRLLHQLWIALRHIDESWICHHRNPSLGERFSPHFNHLTLASSFFLSWFSIWYGPPYAC